MVVFCAAMVRFYLNRREENIVLHLSLLLLLSLAISPITWAHHYMIALLPFLYLWCRLKESEKDKLLLATFLTVGTTVVLFILPFSLERVRLLVVGIVPCLTVCLVWFRIVGEERPQISLDKTF